MHSFEVRYSQAMESFKNYFDKHHSDIVTGLSTGCTVAGAPYLGAAISLADAAYSSYQGDKVGAGVVW
jgi:hypothetical protein